MPTEPFRLLLDRAEAVSRARPLTDLVSPVLQEVINYSTLVLVRCESQMAPKGNDDRVHVAPLVLFRRSIELTDAIETLLSQSCVEPAFPLLRSSLEATLSLRYIFETGDEEKEKERSLAWLCGNVHNRLCYSDMIRKRKVSDEIPAVTPDAIVADAEKEYQKLQVFLKKPHMQRVLAEHRAQKRQPPRWYSLFKGPNDLRSLAERLGWTDYYLLYKSWSRDVHSSGNVEKVFKLTQGRQTVEPLRVPGSMFQVAVFAEVFLGYAMLTMARRYRSGEEEQRKAWYKAEVFPAMERIQKTSIKIDAQAKRW